MTAPTFADEERILAAANAVIAKNEAQTLPRCLASVAGWTAEIVVALNKRWHFLTALAALPQPPTLVADAFGHTVTALVQVLAALVEQGFDQHPHPRANRP